MIKMEEDNKWLLRTTIRYLIAKEDKSNGQIKSLMPRINAQMQLAQKHESRNRGNTFSVKLRHFTIAVLLFIVPGSFLVQCTFCYVKENILIEKVCLNPMC